MRTALTAFVVLPLLEWISFARLERTLDAAARLLPAAPVDQVAAAIWVDTLLARLPPPWRFTCLRRAIVLYHMLRAGGAPVTLCIGVRREGDASLRAHAWLLIDGVLALEPARIAERVSMFTEIARFPAAQALTP